MLDVGLNVKLVPIKLPGLSVYVFAPVGVITVEPPLHITLLLPKGAIVIVGVAFTVKLTVNGGLAMQPLVVPVTV